MKSIRYALEALLLQIFFFIMGLLPAGIASDIGGWIGRMIGPRLAASRKALRNVEKALPGLSAEERHRVLIDMWDNLGRVAAEYPHLEAICRERIEIVNGDAATAMEPGVLFIGAHMANWELYSPMLFTRMNRPIDFTYRAPNNPWSDRLITRKRTLGGRIRGHAKSRKGGRDLIAAVKERRDIGILIDQKYNEGIAVPFFDMEAMTNPVFVLLAQKNKMQLVPIQNIRTGGARFKMIFYDPLPLFDDKGEALPAADVVRAAHALLEEWIREYPGQWLWLHRRWDSAALS